MLALSINISHILSYRLYIRSLDNRQKNQILILKIQQIIQYHITLTPPTYHTKLKDKIGASTELSKSENCLNAKHRQDFTDHADDESLPPPVPPLPINYQRSDGK